MRRPHHRLPRDDVGDPYVRWMPPPTTCIADRDNARALPMIRAIRRWLLWRSIRADLREIEQKKRLPFRQ